MKGTALSIVLGATLAILMYSAPAEAQATRTWVSGVGDDANPCSRTAPCKTFAGAISKTAANGEINCLDPGGFGAVTITKSISIVCDHTVGGVLAALTNGININAAGVIVTLRGLDIEGAGNGLIGINIIQAAEVHVQKCSIRGFRGGTGAAIVFAPSAGGYLAVTDSYLSDSLKGIRITAPASFAVAAINNVAIVGMSVSGVELASNNAFASVRNSVLADITGSALLTTTSNGTLNVERSAILNNSTAVNAGG